MSGNTRRLEVALCAPGSPSRRGLLQQKVDQGKITQQEFEQLLQQENQAAEMAEEVENAQRLQEVQSSPGYRRTRSVNKPTDGLLFAQIDRLQQEKVQLQQEKTQLQEKSTSEQLEFASYKELSMQQIAELTSSLQSVSTTAAEHAEQTEKLQGKVKALTSLVLSLCPITVRVVRTEKVSGHAKGIVGDGTDTANEDGTYYTCPNSVLKLLV